MEQVSIRAGFCGEPVLVLSNEDGRLDWLVTAPFLHMAVERIVCTEKEVSIHFIPIND